MQNARLDEAQARIKVAGRNINNLRCADDTTLMAESEEELKSLLMIVKEEIEKVGLKLNIQKTNLMTSGPITSWEIDGETMETVTDFTSWSLKSLQMVTTAMKWTFRSFMAERTFAPWKKTVTSLDSILQSRDMTLMTKVCLVKAMVFSSSHVWM